jgi:pyruvate formate lyase activating enzyme
MREVDGQVLPDRSKQVPDGLDAVCPSLAIRVAGRVYTSEDLVVELLKDEVFFRQSGGGVTFSGGEPLIHQAFLLACVADLQANGISVAIETCLAVDTHTLDRFLAYPILWLLDLKHVVPGIFKEKTGGDLELVLRNLRKIAATAPAVTFRIPLIPGFNDGDKDREGLFDFIAGLDRATEAPPEVHILPYHDLAAGKYSHLGRDYPYAGIPGIDGKSPEKWKAEAARRGFRASIGG